MPAPSDQQLVDILGAVKRHHGNVSAAAAELGIARGTARGRLQQAILRPLPKRAVEKAAEPESVQVAGKRFVITSAQNATPVNQDFFAALQEYADFNSSQLLVVPFRYHNPTSIWSEEAQAADVWAPELLPHIVTERTRLCPGLILLADIKTQPTAVSPLSGFETITGPCSAIIGHPKLQLTTVPTPQNTLPKILTTTGCCTLPNYVPSKAGKKAEHHHTYGACVVELDDDGTFHLRQINACADGSFIDLECEYWASGVRRAPPAAGLVMGDTHAKMLDPRVAAATWCGPDSILDALKPKALVWHDVLDFYSRNHHHKHDPLLRFAKHHSHTSDNVRDELEECFALIDSASRPGMEHVIVSSNHPDAFAKWVKDTDPREDPENALIWAETYAAMCKAARIGAAGFEGLDPFAYWGQQLLSNPQAARFLRADESHMVAGIEVGMHGHQGPNGSRGTRKSFTKIGCKSVVGHSHSPGIEGGVYQVGTSSRLNLDYSHGPSSWLGTHCVIYANGKRSLINIINGKWRGEQC